MGVATRNTEHQTEIEDLRKDWWRTLELIDKTTDPRVLVALKRLRDILDKQLKGLER